MDVLFDASPVGTALLDSELNYVRANPAWSQVDGIPAAEHVGRNLVADSPALAGVICPLVEQVLATGRPLVRYRVQVPLQKVLLQKLPSQRENTALLPCTYELSCYLRPVEDGTGQDGDGPGATGRSPGLVLFMQESAQGLTNAFQAQIVQPEHTAATASLARASQATPLEEHRLTEEVSASGQFLQSSLDALKSHICILDTSGVILAVNEEWRRFARENGLDSPDAGIGDNYLAVCDCASDIPDAGRVGFGIRAVMYRRTDEFYLEYPCHTPTERRWFGVRITPLSGETQPLRRVVVSHENITARKEAELSLVASEERYRVLANALPAVVFVIDDGGNCEYCNQRWYEFTGLTEDQTLGEGWLSVVHPDDREEAHTYRQHAMSHGQILRSEYRFRRHDGAYRWHLSVALPWRDDNGKILHWFGTATDVHDRKEAEARTQILAEVGQALSTSLDYERGMQELARLCVPRLAPWCAVHIVEGGELQPVGVAHADAKREPVVRQVLERYLPDPHLQGGFWDVVVQRRPVMYHALPANMGARLSPEDEVLLNQQLGTGSMIIAPLAVRDRCLGTLSLYAGHTGQQFTASEMEFAAELARDAALYLDNARLFREAKRARAEAETALRTKDEFLAVVSHELRTPLTPLLGWVQLLRSESDMVAGGQPTAAMMEAANEIRTQALDTIERNVRAQTQLVNDLLDVSRITTGKMRLDLRPTNLQSVVAGAVTSLYPTAQARGILLDENYSLMEAQVMGDADRLQQVVWNLVSNAVKFTPPGGRVLVQLANENDTATLRVQDSGRGIAPEFLPRVFERFSQADSSSTRAHGGLGLGLSIVRHLVELHGGSVEVRSEGLGHGATFLVHLPLLAATDAQAD